MEKLLNRSTTKEGRPRPEKDTLANIFFLLLPWPPSHHPYLALVNPIIPRLRRQDFQGPHIRSVHVLRLEPLVVRVRHNANGQDVEVPLPDPGHGPVPDVEHAAVQVGDLAHCGCHFPFCGVVETGLGRIRVVPVQRVLLGGVPD